MKIKMHAIMQVDVVNFNPYPAILVIGIIQVNRGTDLHFDMVIRLISFGSHQINRLFATHKSSSWRPKYLFLKTRKVESQ